LGTKLIASIAAAIAFYTCLPVPGSWALKFQGVAKLAPAIGLLIGGLLAITDGLLEILGIPVLSRSALVVVAWVGITGGLHLDGAMDTADGLAVTDPQRRLQVMADSVTGAFGAIACASILLLKTAALTDIETDRWLALMMVAGWGRWGQMLAILRYPYLKPTGKGAFHKEAIRSVRDVVPMLVLLLGLTGLQVILAPEKWSIAVGMALEAGAIAFLVGAWFNHKLGGHTGDSYGAVVEWTEAVLLCLLTV